MLVDPKSQTGSQTGSQPESLRKSAPESQSDASEPPRDERPGKAGVALVAVLIAAGAIGGYRLLARTQAEPTPVEKPQTLEWRDNQVTVPEGSPVRRRLVVAPVAAEDIRRDLVLPAAAEADPARLIKVLPPLAGRVTRLNVQLGERVENGQPLVVLDSPDLGTAYADYERAKAQLALTLKNRDRQRGLAKIGGAAEKDMQQAESDYLAAEAELKRTVARLQQIGVDAESTAKSRTVTVSAPMSGSIIELDVAPGAYWNDPTASLMTVADLRTIWVTAGVPEKDTALVAKGQPVDVVFSAYPNETFHGEVLFVSDVLDTDTRRTKVRIAFDNPDTRLRPGMFASVTFHAPAQRAAVVPASALLLKDDVNQVLVETAPWTFAARNVDIAFQQGDQVVLRSGVAPGERIVVKGGVLLGD
jgi:cobalt-zinc-cadmium efflux system membrane fusion protein